MIGETQLLFSTLDPNKKDARWVNDCVTLIRRNWVQLKDSETMRINKQIIFGQQSMKPVKKTFKDKAFLKNTEFEPLGTWNRIINIIVEELTKAPPKIELKANDSIALTDKEEDIRLLRLKTLHENAVNEITKRAGLPPTRIGDDFFKTNIGDFYRMGLDPNNPEDIDFYEQNDFPRLKYEIAGQKLINEIIRLNRFDKETIRDFVLDIAAGLCCCMQIYVDSVTGEIVYDRIYPEEAYGIWGDKRDGTDDIGSGWVKNITVREWMSRVGNDFTFEKDWTQLLWALNYANKTKYTGFIRFGNKYDCYGDDALMNNPNATYNGASQSNLMDYSLAYTYNIYSGYIEWDSPEATATYLAEVGSGKLTPKQVPFDYFLDNKKEQTEYYKESFYGFRKYKTYMLPTSSTSQWIYNFGKVYYSELHGAADQYCKGTLWYYRLEGNSAAEISKPYVEFANLAFYRMKWAVYHSKPKKEQFVIAELIKVAKSMQRLYPQNNEKSIPTVDNILTQLIEWKRENFIDIRDFPEIEGKTYPQLAPTESERGGIDPLALGLQAIEQWLEMQISEKVGLNDMRMGQIQNAREGYKKGVEETQASLNSTSYFYRMIQYTKEHAATTTLTYAQDIVKFKDSIPYKYLLKLLGQNELENIKLLKDFAAHRYGITVEEYVSQQQKQKLLAAADMALDKGDGKGGITLMEWGIINGTENYKDALKKLALFKYKADKKKRKQELEMEKIRHDNVMAEKKQEQQQQQEKDKSEFERTKLITEAQKYVADKNAEGKIEIKQMGIDHDAPKQDTRTQSQKQIIQEKNNVENQKSLGK